MADIFTKKKRSQIMASISGKETKPEILVRSFLFGEGFRFRKNVKALPGKPDIVLPKYRKIIFIHGCFWHGHNCKKGLRPATNKEFWNNKIQSNIKHDKKVNKKLRQNNWTVLTIWECSLKTKNGFDNTMKNLINKIIN